ncbi:MAG: hypothetical protein MK033_01800 [Candidatus Caenarcaniphilales bacterium]|nr:hypothetical protein [Candidatus Caenarcaniphilales bacterium]
MYYTNFQKKEFETYLEQLGLDLTDKLREASTVFIDLEKLIFSKNPKLNFSNHMYKLSDLNFKFNELIKSLAKIDEKNGINKQHRILRINLVDIKSTADEDLFYWSYYSHKYASSKGKDKKALEDWHKLEDKIDTDRLAEFKARREINLSFFVQVIKQHNFFNRIIFAKNRKFTPNLGEYGLDIAEEHYIDKTIREYHSQNICSLNEACLASPLIFLSKKIMEEYKLKSLKGFYISNSRKLDHETQLDIKSIFNYLNIEEVNLEETDFIILVNDLDLLTNIPPIDSNKPIFVVDLSMSESPSFSYMLLKDPGFSQVYSYSKKRYKEDSHSAIIRSLSSGLISLARGERFIDQIAVNYMDDYFTPLSKSLNQPLKSFVNPISLLAQRLEEDA